MARKKALDMELWRHQQQLIEAPWNREDINYFFLIGGYGCGKTSGDVFFLFNLINRYFKTPITVGVFGVTITLLRKTLIGEFEKYLVLTGTKYTDDRNANTITVGSVVIHLIALEQPQLIYAYNLNISLVDELDELPADKCMAAFTAIQERTRVTLPDGREAFSVFTTTAQGYSGTYAVVESLKDAGQKFVIIRGQTKDNLALSRSYVDKLYALYDDNERLAYLEGFFVNLNTGKVYGDYNPDVNLGKTNMPVSDIHVVHIGQDFNAGFSKGVALVKEGKILHAVKTFNFQQIQHAPRIIRNAFPTNNIFWYPDASAKEIMAGYVTEVRDHNIDVRIGTVNPPIVERILFVNKLFKTGRLIVDPICRDLDIALKTRQFDDTGKPEKGRGESATDHVCLMGDTLVETDNGRVAIRDIRVGDKVLTRYGYRVVLDAMCTGIANVSNVHGVYATQDHPFYVGNGVFKQAGTLTEYDVPLIAKEKELRQCKTLNRHSLYLKGLSTEDTRTLRAAMTAYITKLRDTDTCIDGYGLQHMARSLRDSLFTIKTAIRLITRWTIWSALKGAFIWNDICEKSLTLIQTSIRARSIKQEKRQRRGTLVTKAVLGIANTLKSRAVSLHESSSVNVAEGASWAKLGLSTALKRALLKLEEIAVMTMSSALVCSAESLSRLVSTRTLFAAPQSAQPALESPVSVYNITVDSAHEYYANGVLVSNCDALEYATWRVALSDPDYADLRVLVRSK